MNLEWFSKERLTNKVSIIGAISAILYMPISFFFMSVILPLPIEFEMLQGAILLVLSYLLAPIVIVLSFAGAICGVIGLVKDFKAKQRPSKISLAALLVNLFMVLLVFGLILWSSNLS